jgi:hypothetical protein
MSSLPRARSIWRAAVAFVLDQLRSNQYLRQAIGVSD